MQNPERPIFDQTAWITITPLIADNIKFLVNSYDHLIEQYNLVMTSQESVISKYGEFTSHIESTVSKIGEQQCSTEEQGNSNVGKIQHIYGICNYLEEKLSKLEKTLMQLIEDRFEELTKETNKKLEAFNTSINLRFKQQNEQIQDVRNQADQEQEKVRNTLAEFLVKIDRNGCDTEQLRQVVAHSKVETNELVSSHKQRQAEVNQRILAKLEELSAFNDNQTAVNAHLQRQSKLHHDAIEDQYGESARSVFEVGQQVEQLNEKQQKLGAEFAEFRQNTTSQYEQLKKLQADFDAFPKDQFIARMKQGALNAAYVSGRRKQLVEKLVDDLELDELAAPDFKIRKEEQGTTNAERLQYAFRNREANGLEKEGFLEQKAEEVEKSRQVVSAKCSPWESQQSTALTIASQLLQTSVASKFQNKSVVRPVNVQQQVQQQQQQSQLLRKAADTASQRTLQVIQCEQNKQQESLPAGEQQLNTNFQQVFGSKLQNMERISAELIEHVTSLEQTINVQDERIKQLTKEVRKREAQQDIEQSIVELSVRENEKQLQEHHFIDKKFDPHLAQIVETQQLTAIKDAQDQQHQPNSQDLSQLQDQIKILRTQFQRFSQNQRVIANPQFDGEIVFTRLQKQISQILQQLQLIKQSLGLDSAEQLEIRARLEEMQGVQQSAGPEPRLASDPIPKPKSQLSPRIRQKLRQVGQLSDLSDVSGASSTSKIHLASESQKTESYAQNQLGIQYNVANVSFQPKQFSQFLQSNISPPQLNHIGSLMQQEFDFEHRIKNAEREFDKILPVLLRNEKYATLASCDKEIFRQELVSKKAQESTNQSTNQSANQSACESQVFGQSQSQGLLANLSMIPERQQMSVFKFELQSLKNELNCQSNEFKTIENQLTNKMLEIKTQNKQIQAILNDIQIRVPVECRSLVVELLQQAGLGELVDGQTTQDKAQKAEQPDCKEEGERAVKSYKGERKEVSYPGAVDLERLSRSKSQKEAEKEVQPKVFITESQVGVSRELAQDANGQVIVSNQQGGQIQGGTKYQQEAASVVEDAMKISDVLSSVKSPLRPYQEYKRQIQQLGSAAELKIDESIVATFHPQRQYEYGFNNFMKVDEEQWTPKAYKKLNPNIEKSQLFQDVKNIISQECRLLINMNRSQQLSGVANVEIQLQNLFAYLQQFEEQITHKVQQIANKQMRNNVVMLEKQLQVGSKPAGQVTFSGEQSIENEQFNRSLSVYTPSRVKSRRQ